MAEETKQQKEARLMALVEKGQSSKVSQEERDWLWENSLAYHEMGDYGTGRKLEYDSEEANQDMDNFLKERAEQMKKNAE
jgi:hypothetical protein